MSFGDVVDCFFKVYCEGGDWMLALFDFESVEV